MTVKARLAAVARMLPRPRLVIVRPSYPGIPPTPIGPHPRGVALTVPSEAAGDPMAALTPAQRQQIRPHDQVLVVRRVPHHGTTSES